LGFDLQHDVFARRLVVVSDSDIEIVPRRPQTISRQLMQVRVKIAKMRAATSSSPSIAHGQVAAPAPPSTPRRRGTVNGDASFVDRPRRRRIEPASWSVQKARMRKVFAQWRLVYRGAQSRKLNPVSLDPRDDPCLA
jgi:hypothetical protein